MMRRYAAVAGLPRRLILPVPVLTPRLSSHWVGLVTPVPRVDRPAARRVAAARGGLPRARHRPLRARPARAPGRLRRGGAAGPAAGARGAGRHPLVVRLRARRAQRPAAHRPRLGGRQPLHRPARAGASTRRPHALWRVIEGIGGEQRLVLLPARLGGARLAGPAGRRGGAAPGPPGRRAAAGRATRWTSGGSRRSSRAGCCGCAPRCGCRAWPGWRCTRTRDDDGPHPLPPARPVPSARAARARVLVERGALPRRRSSAAWPATSRGRRRRTRPPGAAGGAPA